MKENLLSMEHNLRGVWNGWYRGKVNELALDRKKDNISSEKGKKERQNLNKGKFASVGWKGQEVHT